jgi:hypothetical protein
MVLHSGRYTLQQQLLSEQLPAHLLHGVRRALDADAKTIPCHLAVEELAAALESGPEAFQARYQHPLPPPEAPLLLLSRTNQRALWAAQLAQDAGWSRWGPAWGGGGGSDLGWGQFPSM